VNTTAALLAAFSVPQDHIHHRNPSFNIYSMFQKKMAQSLRHHIFATVHHAVFKKTSRNKFLTPQRPTACICIYKVLCVCVCVSVYLFVCPLITQEPVGRSSPIFWVPPGPRKGGLRHEKLGSWVEGQKIYTFCLPLTLHQHRPTGRTGKP